MPLLWKIRRAARSGSLAPFFASGTSELSNLVAACKPCNSRKKDRTPDEALMPLLPVGAG